MVTLLIQFQVLVFQYALCQQILLGIVIPRYVCHQHNVKVAIMAIFKLAFVFSPQVALLDILD